MMLKGYIYKGITYIGLLMFFASCMDELYTTPVESSFLSVRGGDLSGLQGSVYPGDTEDNKIHTLRILSFDRSTGDCTSNIRYNAGLGDIIRHPVSVGAYDFVFLANEPLQQDLVSTLNGISIYEDLNKIAYPADYFTSEGIIPMIQEIKNISILPNGKGARLSDDTETTLLELALERLGIRVDVTLEAENDFDTALKGVIFSNLPNKVSLTADYNGPVIERNVTRTFTVSEDGSYFSDATPGTPGANWAKKVNRIILPSNEPESKEDKTKAVVFTVDMGDNYSPSCELKISQTPVNYSLPINTKLDLTGIIKEPLEVNIQASKWDDAANNWNIAGNRILNVSDIEVDITDYNGARISFWSNMPIVRVLETVRVKSTNTYLPTNEVFNALSSQSWQPNWDERIIYDPHTGAGYMDILLDLPNTTGRETYELTLVAAEDFSGKNGIQRTITVNVKQEGKRYAFLVNSPTDLWSTPYVGAFYRDEQMGERVISGYLWSYWYRWIAEVPAEYKDFIVISSTPSFDPNIGTDTPGNPEDYPVVPNYQKGETGDYAQGRGRIYFRIGLKSQNPDKGTPRYGIVKFTYYMEDVPYETNLYVRQGEAADYVMRSGATAGVEFGGKFSPYNLTVAEFLNNPSTPAEWYQIDFDHLADEMDFVEYPTQAGAHFQWGVPVEYADLGRRAYHPTNVNTSRSSWELTEWPIRRIDTPVYWAPATGVKLGDYYEICPPGYYRPTDGPLDRLVMNSYNDSEVQQSEWRMSLFRAPMRGDGNSATIDKPVDPLEKPEKYDPQLLSEIKYGFYADGFFDRRPIQEREMIDGMKREKGAVSKYKGVSLDNTKAAFNGVLFFNAANNASVFFPAAGRRWHMDGSLEYASETGYYWSSSVAPGWTDTTSGQEKGSPHGNVWAMEFNYVATTPMSTGHQFGLTIRCVKR